MQKNGRKRSIGINALLNATKSALSILFPLITYRYVYRVLQAENIGKVEFANSIVEYFSLIAFLGISSYAIREGSKYRDDQKRINCFASDIFTVNCLSTLVAYALLILSTLLIPKLNEYRILIYCISISIILKTTSTDWINSIYEDYLFLTIRSIAVHVISLIVLFITVKKPDDYIKYALITVGSNAIICISNRRYCKKYVKLSIRITNDIKRHLRPIMVLFANSIAGIIYVNSDMTMLGWICDTSYVGIYSMAVKVYNVIKTIIVSIYSTTIPRISYYIGKKNTQEVKRIYTRIVCTIILLLLPIATGLFFASEDIVLVLGGEGYTEAILTLKILCIALICAIFGGLITYCLSIPLGREKINLQATSISAILNIVLNLILIPKFKQNGAAVTTVLSELFVFVYCFTRFKDIKRYLDFKQVKKSLRISAFGCIIVAVTCVLIEKFLNLFYLSIALKILLSMAFYFTYLYEMKNEMVISLANKIKVRIKNE